MVVWRGEQVLYVSPGEPGALRTIKQRQLERVTVAGVPWRTYTQASEHSDARVTLIRSGHALNILFALGGRGILVLPLLISLPFLVLPAWLSVHLALRPWRRFSEEVAARGPDDLAPLKFGSQYRELRPLSQAVNGLLERLQRSVARERSFIADAAHELRTPLAAMRVNVEALQRDPAPAQAGELMTGLVRSLERSTRLVAQLLGLMRSDGEGQAAGREPIELSGLVQDRLAVLSMAARARQVELDFTRAEDGTVQGEREGLISLVDNLVENAIKYSPVGSVVMVSVRREGAALELCVQDHGDGIPEALRERVFTRFFRAPDQVQPGSGLGLAIVKAVAERHGAEVTLGESSWGGLQVSVEFSAG
jgi:two-component system sensor histidine kinase QseC